MTALDFKHSSQYRKITLNTPSIAPRLDSANDEGEVAISADTQQALDHVLEVMDKLSLCPVFAIKGSLISVCLDLNTQLLEMLPDSAHVQGKKVMEHIIHSLCDFAQAQGLGGFELVMEFKA